MTTTDTTTDTDTTTVEPEEATTVDTETTDTSEASPGDDSEVDEDQDDAGDGPGREAAKYRRRLREAETERDRLSERVESLQRAEVERLATADSLRPAALWSSGVELADLLSDDGTVSAAKVSAAIDGAREQLGIPNPPPRNYVKNEGRSLGRPSKPSGKAAMVSVVMGRDSDDS